jgi:hypothetical protein
MQRPDTNPPVRYHIDASRRNVYAVHADGSYRWLAISPDELERQMQRALETHRDQVVDNPPSVDKTLPR